MRTICIAGHRQDRIGGWDDNHPLNIKVRDILCSLLAALKVKYKGDLRIVSGGDLGVAQWAITAAQAAEIPVTVAIPFRGFSRKWPAKSQDTFDTMMDKVDKVYLVHNGDDYSPKWLKDRSSWMVDNSDYMIVFYNPEVKNSDDGRFSATGSIINYAIAQKVPVLIIDVKKIEAGLYDQALSIEQGDDPKLNKELAGIKLYTKNLGDSK